MVPFEENELNITHLIIAGFVDLPRYRYFYFVLLLPVYIFIVSFNAIIVYIIFTQKSLHEPMYIFIAAVLMNDVLSIKSVISFKGCLIQSFIVYSLGGSEFWLLSAMAYDRYVSICKPLQYHTLLKMKIIKMILAFAWVWPLSQVAIIHILIFFRAMRVKVCDFNLEMIFCDITSVNKVICGYATVSYWFGIYTMIVLIFVPMFFIVFTYARILIVCLQNSKEFRKKAVQTCVPHLLVLMTFSLLAIFDTLKDSMFSDHTVRFILAIQLIIYPCLFNPIIYGLKMKEISKQLKKLFSQNKNQWS